MKNNATNTAATPEAVQRAIDKEAEQGGKRATARRSVLAKGSAKVSLDNWLPGPVRKEIEEIRRMHPGGFTQCESARGEPETTVLSSDVALARLERRRSWIVAHGGGRSAL